MIGVAKDWFNLGLALELGYDTLDSIKDEYHRNKDCLREMIAARLKTGPLTYSELCQSLRAQTVRRNDVADAIEEECTGMNSNTVLYRDYAHLYCMLQYSYRWDGLNFKNSSFASKLSPPRCLPRNYAHS